MTRAGDAQRSVAVRNELWEILVPCNWNDGNPIRTRHHREWDRRVRAVTGGLTVLKPAMGQWENEGELYRDRVIPVRIMTTAVNMNIIAGMTIAHYEQLAVMYYRVSDACIIHEATADQRQRFNREDQHALDTARPEGGETV